MELSHDKAKGCNSSCICYNNNELIDVDKIQFESDETWLMHSYLEVGESNTNKKVLDSRTYTRPKRSLPRGTIQDFNEQFMGISRSDESLTKEIENYMSSTSIKSNHMDNSMPIHFDLSQPTYTNIFDNILMNSDVDSFQNMSPPSLVNSMCSSTFTNIMDGSYVAGDFTLNEIRDTDILKEDSSQDIQINLYQNVTDSCNSINSETAELFVKRPVVPSSNNKSDDHCNLSDDNLSQTLVGNNLSKSKCNGDRSYTKNIFKEMSSSNNSDIQSEGDDKDENNFENTFVKDSNSPLSGSPLNKDETYNLIHSENIDPNGTRTNLNGTFTRPPKLNGTFQRPPPRRNVTQNVVNKTRNMDEIVDCFNAITLHDRTTDLKNETHIVNRTITLKKNSDDFTSTDSLERTSSPSSSSRGSSRFLNMAEVDAIVELQEMNLLGMSTPKPAKSMTKLFDEHSFSPIRKERDHVSDSDLSSVGDYLTGRTTLSKVSSTGGSIRNVKSPERPAKSMVNLTKTISEPKARTQGTLVRPPMGSRLTKLSYAGFKRPEHANSGLNSYKRTAEATVKGASYTNLKPVGVNLPVITPVDCLNYQKSIESSQEAKASVVPAPQPSNAAPFSYAKVQAKSGLPRPIGTGIPKPVSKIPGLRVARPQSSKVNSQAVNKLNTNHQGY